MPAPHYFIAIPIPSGVRNLLLDWQEALKDDVYYKEWPHPDDFHITLKFLGSVTDTKLEKIMERLTDVQTIEAFQVKVGNLGWFGNQVNPRVVWAGIELTDQLMALQKTVELILDQIGYTTEKRPYCPHITLAKKWAGIAFKTRVDALTERYNQQQKMDVDTVILYKIHPNKYPKYEEKAKFKLNRG